MRTTTIVTTPEAPLSLTSCSRTFVIALPRADTLEHLCCRVRWHCSSCVKDIGAAFQNRSDLRPFICAALQRLCLQNRAALQVRRVWMKVLSLVTEAGWCPLATTVVLITPRPMQEALLLSPHFRQILYSSHAISLP